MQKDFFYEIIKYKPLLFKKIIANYKEQCIVSPLEDKYKGFEFLLKNQHIKQKFTKENPSFSWDYTDEKKRLALLSTNELSELSLCFGVCLHAKEIAQTISKDEINQIKIELGIELYTFAIERGQYRLPKLCDIFSKKDVELPLVERIKLHGQLCVSILGEDWSEHEKKKLPTTSLSQNSEISELSNKDKETIFFALKKILTTEITSEWQQCLD